MKLPSLRRGKDDTEAEFDTTPDVSSWLGGGGRKKPDSYASRDWALETVVDNLTFAGDRVIAWYLLEPQMWSFRPDHDAEHFIETHAAQLANLVKSTVHIRVTTRPYPVSEWARRHVENAMDPLPYFTGPFMEAEYANLASRTLAHKLTYYGVDLGARGQVQKMLAKLNSSVVDREMLAWQERIDELTGVMAGPGIEGRPAVGRDMEWLLQRSFGLGMPTTSIEGPETRKWSPADLAQFTETVRWTAEPYAESVVVRGLSDSDLERHVIVLTIGRCGEMQIPETDVPWMSKSDRLDFPVEWSARVTVRETDEVTTEMQKLASRIDNQYKHYVDEHNMRPPKSLSRQAARVADIEDELKVGFDGLSTRTKGWYRIAVSGRDLAEAKKRAKAVKDLYGPLVRVERTFDQLKLAREFVPGEPLGNSAHVRHFPILKVAAAVPAATAEAGDPRGIYLGTTCGLSERVVTWDPWYLTEVIETTGLTPIIGGLGSGKSHLMGLIIYKTVLQGVRWTILDPSGRLNALCRLPELRGIAEAVDLVGAQRGILSPYRVVVDPQLEHYADEDDPQAALQYAMIQARVTRGDLCYDVLRKSLPYRLGRRESTEDLLRQAVDGVDATSWASPWDVIHLLERKGTEEANKIARELRIAAEREQGSLFFPPPDMLDADRDHDTSPRKLLTSLNLKGVVIGDETEKDPEEWSFEERLGRPLTSIAAWLAMRSIYLADPNERKGLAIDEAHELTKTAGGRKLVQKTATDTRKHNTKALVTTQNAQYVLGADIGNFVGSAFLGRTEDADAQAAALRMAQLPAGVGYEDVLARLSPRMRRQEKETGFREFIFKDGMGGDDGRGGIEKIRIDDLKHHPHVATALNTTSDPSKAKRLRPNLVDLTSNQEQIA